ncbi:MAG: hypothetical protein AB1896_22675, partial [Thermodesulfobacteriota bacterium]
MPGGPKRSDQAVSRSRRMIVFYIISPAFLMIGLAIIETYLFPLFLEQPQNFINETKIDVLISLLWVVLVSFKLRNRIPRYWFYSWWPILSILVIVAIYLLGAFAGLPLGREENFSGVVVMLPTIGFLLLLSLGSVIYYALKALGKRWP